MTNISHLRILFVLFSIPRLQTPSGDTLMSLMLGGPDRLIETREQRYLQFYDSAL